jgi:uncharacterized protein YktB (UPF0637 family)
MFTGFTSDDFNVFTINGLDERMAAIKETVRPKLEALGQHHSASLTAMTGDEMFYHVAKHARRSVNPPDDTWVAFANNKRGYKKHPHFQIGLWETHLFMWFAIIYESPIKADYAKALKSNLSEIQKQIPSNFVWSVDHTKPDGKKHEHISTDEFNHMFDRLETVKKAELLCGIHIDREDPILKDKDAFLAKTDEVFETLNPLFQLAKQLELD